MDNCNTVMLNCNIPNKMENKLYFTVGTNPQLVWIILITEQKLNLQIYTWPGIGTSMTSREIKLAMGLLAIYYIAAGVH
jgi:hypothetical protein